MKKRITDKVKTYTAVEKRNNAFYAMMSKLNSTRVVPCDTVEFDDYGHDRHCGGDYCERHDTSWSDCDHDHWFDDDGERDDYDY